MIVAFYPNEEDHRSAESQQGARGDVLAAATARCVQCAHALATRLGNMRMKPTGQVERGSGRPARSNSGRVTAPLQSPALAGRSGRSSRAMAAAAAMLPTPSLELAAFGAEDQQAKSDISGVSGWASPPTVNLYAPAMPDRPRQGSTASVCSSIRPGSPTGSTAGSTSMRLIKVAAGKLWPFRGSMDIGSKGMSHSAAATSASCKLERLRPDQLPQRRPVPIRHDLMTPLFARYSVDTEPACPWPGYEAAGRRVASVSGGSRRHRASSPQPLHVNQAGPVLEPLHVNQAVPVLEPQLGQQTSASDRDSSGTDEVRSAEEGASSAESRSGNMLPGPSEGADGVLLHGTSRVSWKSKFQSLSVAMLAPASRCPPVANPTAQLQRQLSTTAFPVVDRSRLSYTDQHQSNASMPLTLLSRQKSGSGGMRADGTSQLQTSNSSSSSLQKNMFHRIASRRQLQIELGVPTVVQQHQPRFPSETPVILIAPASSLELYGSNADDSVPWGMMANLVLGCPSPSPTGQSMGASPREISQPSHQDYGTADQAPPSTKVRVFYGYLFSFSLVCMYEAMHLLGRV